jgi:hypothetical protein
MTSASETPNLLVELIVHADTASLIWQVGVIVLVSHPEKTACHADTSERSNQKRKTHHLPRFDVAGSVAGAHRIQTCRYARQSA